MHNSKGKIIVIVAPSGTGKSTLIRKILTDIPSLKESVSYTTRKKRPGEIDGVHYHFISGEEFEEMKAAGEFLEWALVHSNFYGTSKKFVENKIEQGQSLLFDLDVQGADAFKSYFSDLANIIFIAPPSLEELSKRLKSRGTESEESRKERLANAARELLRKDDYDYLVINEDFDKCLGQMEKIIKSILGEDE